MSLLKSVLYGFVSGITEFLPISSRAHQALLGYLFGIDTRDSIQNLLVHIGVFFAILLACREYLTKLRNEQRAISGSVRRRIRSSDIKSFYDLRLLKTATFPLIIGLLLCFSTIKMGSSLLVIMGFLVVNGSVLLLADHVSHGNRDSRTMTGLDGIVMGIMGALSAFPGISRTGMITSYATMRGADSQNVTNWAVLLGLPAMVFAVCFDFVGIVTDGVGVITFSVLLGYILSAATAFVGGYLGISLLRAILNHTGFSLFAYYSLGEALFFFILYLIT